MKSLDINNKNNINNSPSNVAIPDTSSTSPQIKPTQPSLGKMKSLSGFRPASTGDSKPSGHPSGNHKPQENTFQKPHSSPKIDTSVSKQDTNVENKRMKSLNIPKNSFTKQGAMPQPKAQKEIIQHQKEYPKKENADDKKSVDLKDTDKKAAPDKGAEKKPDISSKKSDDKPVQIKSENKKDENLLSVTDFYCQYYSLIKEIIDNVLTRKYSSKLVAAIEDEKERMKIENESIEDIRGYLTSQDISHLNYSLMGDYIKLICAEAMGFGILEFLLNDKDVDEICVQSHNNIYVEKHGVLVKTGYRFPSYDVALGIVRRIIRPLNKTLDVSNPNVDGQLPNGSRISASIPPLRAEGEISIDIRKFSEKVEPLINYCKKYQSETPEMVKFIESVVAGKKTTIVSGGTGSGKTTLLNSMSYALGPTERIIVIEDTREIKVQIPHVEYYLAVPGNNEGYKGISIADIIRHSLRKRPDRIIVGECRGGEFNEYLNAANTGHEGSMTSVHANSPQELFSRMENMLLKNEETKNMTHEAIMRTLAASVDIIVQTKRLADGSRRITNITECLGYGQDGFDKLTKMKLVKEGDRCEPTRIYLRDIFYFREVETREVANPDGSTKLQVKGQFIATGYVPFCNRELRRKGVGFDNDFYKKRVLMEV